MKTMKIFWLVLIVGLLGFFRVQAVAPCATPVASGTTGNLTWTLCPDSTLTISGTGKMDSDDNSPWSDYASSISSVIVENGVTSIGDYAFPGYDNLTSVTIPTSVTSIGEGAFNGCRSLTSIIIPNSVIHIGNWAFAFCRGLTAVDVAEDNTNYASENGVLFNKTKTALIYCPCGKTGTYQIPNSVTSIEKNAFNNCRSLTSIAIPESVTSIETTAFWYCRSLTAIDVSEDNTNYASENGVVFNKAKTILIRYPEGKTGTCQIPNSVTSIEDYAFYECTGLTSVIIPGSVTSFGEWAFGDCSNLTSVTNLAVTPQEIDVYVFANVPLGNATLTVPAGTKALYEAANVWKDFGTIVEQGGAAPCATPVASGTTGDLTWTLCPDGTLTISGEGEMGPFSSSDIVPWSDYSSSISSVIVENGVTSIGAYAFYYCVGLTSVTIPNSVTSIKHFAFSNCRSLTSVSIPNSVTSIGIQAFESCRSLTSVTIPNSVTFIANWAFISCNNLTAIDVAKDNANYASENGVLFNKAKTDLLCCPGGKTGTYQIPNSVTYIEEAFYGCRNLTSVTIPSSVTDIEGWAFHGCESLTSVTNLAATPQEIDPYTFQNVPLSNATLTVPTGTKALYEAANVWKDFGTIKETAVTIDETSPAGADGTGKFELSLTVPANVLFSGSFTLTLPDGFQLDSLQTKLSGDLSGSLTLTVTQNADSSWLFTITASNLRSMTDNVYQKLVDIVYTIDETVADGNYEAHIQDLSFAFDNGTSIVEPEISANITVDHSYTGIPSVVAETKVYVSGRQLYVSSLVAETVEVYSVAGALLYGKQKAAGEISFPIRQVQKTVLIVRGSSGWVRKVIL